MKKLFLTLGLGLCLTTAFAQSTEEERTVGTTTKSGQVILPQAGDIAIGIDATGVLEYLGNSFNGKTNNSASNIFNYNDNVFGTNSIYGKYFLTDKTAIRVKLHLGFGSDTQKELVQDDKNVAANPDARVEDSYKNSNTALGLRVGYEIRRGYGRLQGFYGAEVGLGISSESHTYEYGNIMDKDNGATSNNFNGNANSRYDRATKLSSGSTFQGLVGGFAGVEYFVAPKLSVGGELGLGILFKSTGDAKLTTESVKDRGTSNPSVETKETKSAGSSSFDFKANYSAAVTVAFHF